jgi:hypothetical protein
MALLSLWPTNSHWPRSNVAPALASFILPVHDQSPNQPVEHDVYMAGLPEPMHEVDVQLLGDVT